MTTAPATTSLPAIRRRHFRCAAVAATFLIGLTELSDSASGQTRWYVNGQSPGQNNGTSWTHAYNDLRDALDTASWGDEIWVATGVYTPDRATGARDMTFVIPAGAKVYGGFAGIETHIDQRQPRAFVATLSGDLNGDDGPDFANRADNSYHVLRITNAGIETLLDGFTITAGNADGFDTLGNGSGGGVSSAGGVTIRDSIFINNSARQQGGGLYNLDGSPIISKCAFIANRAGVGGGVVVFGTGFARGAAAVHGTPFFTNCTFIANHATEFGGALYTTGVAETPILNTCSFIANATDGFGGALVNDSGGLILTSCLFNGNTATGRAGAVSNGTFTTLNACTLVANSASEGGGIHSDFFAPVLTTCIVWGNSDDGGTDQSAQIAGATPIVTYSCVQGWTGSWSGNGNIGDDPLLVDPAGPDALPGTVDDNLRLSSESPCINTGLPLPGQNDLDGHARALCGQIDMGAFEFGIGDVDCNRTVDLADYKQWDRCLTSNQGDPLGQGCKAFDFDGDLDVDLIDFGGYQLAAASHDP